MPTVMNAKVNYYTLFQIGNVEMVSGEDMVQAIRKQLPGSRKRESL